jgi:hypothetical protein
MTPALGELVAIYLVFLLGLLLLLLLSSALRDEL